MSGAAAVFAAVVAAARLGLEVNVTGWLALAEDMSAVPPPAPVTCCACTAARPSRSTPTPRAVSCRDALWKASEEKPDAIIDVATLTVRWCSRSATAPSA